MEQVIKQEEASHNLQAWVVTITAALFFFYEFIQMNLFSTINWELRDAFDLDAVQLGQFFSMYFYANFLCLFLAGSLLDRYSTRKLLIFAVSICTAGTFTFALAKVYWVAALGRFLVGIGASFCFLSCIRIASRWFPPSKMAFVTGVVVTLAMIGGLVAQAPFAMLTEYLGDWRRTLLLNAILGVVILIATIMIVQDRPEGSQDEAAADDEHLNELGLWRCIKLAALNPQNWLGGIYTSLMNLPVFIIGGLWGILYLNKAHMIGEQSAAYATTMFFVGVIIGSLLYGWVSDHIERRILPMIVGAVVSLVVVLVLMYVPNLSFASIVSLFFLIGLVTSSQVLTYPTIAELNPSFLTSTAVSIDSLCIMSSGFIVPPLFGWLMEHGGPHEIVNGAPVYLAADFHRAMLIIPVSFVLALIVSFFMKETYCKAQA